MENNAQSATAGRVASLHLHPADPTGPLRGVPSVEAVAGGGITGDDRYFRRISKSTGQPSRRQVSIIAREQIAEHAATLGLESIPPGAVRANIETEGIDLMQWLGHEVILGGAVFRFYEARLPCEKMDALCAGLRPLMENGRQGVMAEVVTSGRISVGDPVRLAQPAHLSH